MPRITDRIVSPSIQPLALTSCDGGSSLSQDAVLGRRVGGAQTDDGVRQQRMRAEGHHRGSHHLDRVGHDITLGTASAARRRAQSNT
jgi:hypothetical protein